MLTVFPLQLQMAANYSADILRQEDAKSLVLSQVRALFRVQLMGLLPRVPLEQQEQAKRGEGLLLM